MTGLVCDPRYKEHRSGAGHPESPARCDAITEALGKEEFEGRLVKIEAREAAEAEILTCHEPRYFQRVKNDIEAVWAAALEQPGVAGGHAGSLTAALWAAGGVLAAVDALLGGKVSNAFCAVRPPGHHATPSGAMGFCFFNNVAIAARYAQRNHKLPKVLIADWDIHHGNGTQEIFYEDPSVLYFSTHLWPWYPGTGGEDETGRGNGKGTTLNCPLPAGSGAEEIIGAFEDKLAPAAKQFKPDLVLISAGFDSRQGDPLGRFQLTDDDFAALTGLMLDIARNHAEGRLVSVLEGGYSLTGLASAAAAHVRTLCQA